MYFYGFFQTVEVCLGCAIFYRDPKSDVKNKLLHRNISANI